MSRTRIGLLTNGAKPSSMMRCVLFFQKDHMVEE